jgi:hypothetical protein
MDRFLAMAVAEIAEALDDDCLIASVLVSAQTGVDQQVHYFRVRGKPGVQRVLIPIDAPEAEQARDLLGQVSVNMTPPDDVRAVE